MLMRNWNRLSMRVFISFAAPHAELARQLEAGLRRHNIEALSSLDAASRDEWKHFLDHQGADADGFIFVLG
jgi:hypothetical protein